MTGGKSDDKIQREDITATTINGHPALEIGDQCIMLRTTLEEAPPESTEKDYHGRGPYFKLNFDVHSHDGMLEWEAGLQIEPVFVSSGEDDL